MKSPVLCWCKLSELLQRVNFSLARRFFRGEELQEQMNREMAKLGSSSIPKSKLELLLREMFLDLQKNALSQGGNAVIATRIEAFPETNHLDPSQQMRLVALGTAAVVEKTHSINKLGKATTMENTEASPRSN